MKITKNHIKFLTEKKYLNERPVSRLGALPKDNVFLKSVPDTYMAPAAKNLLNPGNRGYQLTGNPGDYVKPTEFGNLPRPYDTSDYGTGESEYIDYSGETEGDTDYIDYSGETSGDDVATPGDTPPGPSPDELYGIPDDYGKRYDNFKYDSETHDALGGDSLKDRTTIGGGDGALIKTDLKGTKLDNIISKGVDKIKGAGAEAKKRVKSLKSRDLFTGKNLKRLLGIPTENKMKITKSHIKFLSERYNALNEDNVQITRKNWGQPLVTKTDAGGNVTDKYSLDTQIMDKDRVGKDVSDYEKYGLFKNKKRLVGQPKYEFDSYVKVGPNTPGLNNPDGPRYYKGTGTGRNPYDSFGTTKAELDAYQKIASNPADSLTYDQYSNMDWFKK